MCVNCCMNKFIFTFMNRTQSVDARDLLDFMSVIFFALARLFSFTKMLR